MSLFPIRLKRGGTITVHLRFTARFPVWIHRRDYLINPHGEKTLCYERNIPFIPSERKSKEELELIGNSQQIFGGAPLLMAARYLQNDIKKSEYFVDMLEGLRDDMHQYYTLKIPENAPLGRYHFELEDRVNGRVFNSKTLDSDYFLVESLQLVKTEQIKGHWVAWVENPSPEPVLAQLCEFGQDFTKDCESKIIELKPNATSPISFKDSGILIYRDGDDFLRLHHEKACLRNPFFQAIYKPNYIMIFSNDPKRKMAFELEKEALEIWQLANGFRPRSAVRTTVSADRYDEMLHMGIINEID